MELTHFEINLAEQVAKLRTETAIKRKRPDFHGLVTGANKDLEIDRQGTFSELLVAKTFNRYWNNPHIEVLDATQPDVGTNIQVRHTKYLTGSLIVHPKDIDNHYYILVVGEIEKMKIVGGILGKDAKNDRWWQEEITRRPCYFIPQKALIPLEELKELVD